MSRNTQATLLLAQHSVLTRMARWAISLIILLSLIAPYVRLVPSVGAVSDAIVISQVYGGAGCGTAGCSTYRNDFIELFNRGTASVTLTNWSVQYGSSGGTTWQVTTIPSATIDSGKFLLIQQGGNANGTNELPDPDVTGTTNMSATAGKVALVSDTTALTGAAPTGPNVIDLVGYGSANGFEGTGPAPAPSTTNAVFRGPGTTSCTDTDNNAGDFTAAPANPRNSATPPQTCGDAAPTVSSTTPDDNATGVALDANITVTFSEAVAADSDSFIVSCTTSGSHTFGLSGGPTTYTLDPDADFANDETCTVTIVAAEVTDQDADDPPDTMADDVVFDFTAAPAVDPAPAVTTTAPADDATGVAVDANIVVNFTEAVTATDASFTIVCAGTDRPEAVTASNANATYALNPTGFLPYDTNCVVTVIAAQVSDEDGADPPDTMEADYTFDFTTAAAPTTRIRDIQGAGHISPLNGTSVAGVQGIVTAIKRPTSGSGSGSNNGFYIQDPDGDDGNIATSEGILVFTGSTTPASLGVAVGDRVALDGLVTEFRPADDALTITEITRPSGGSLSVTVTSTGNALPTPVVIGAGGRVPPTTVINDDGDGNVETGGTFDPATDGLDFYESLEGMLAQVNNAVAVGPQSEFGSGISQNRELPVLADDGGNGAGLRTVRGGIVVRPNDFNPERIILNDLIAGGPSLPAVDVNARLPGATIGVFDYAFGNFKLEVTTLPAVDNTNAVARPGEATTVVGTAERVTVGTFNVENLGGNADQAKYDALADTIVDYLKSPDILALEEIQDNNGETNDSDVAADVTYQRLIQAIVDAGGPTYEFRQVDPVDDQDGGAPGGNIRVGFLFNPSRATFVDRPGGGPTTATTVVNNGGQPQLSASPGRLDPLNPAFDASRKPLVGEFLFGGRTLFVVANHFNSKGGDEALFGRFQPPTQTTETQRRAQAQVINDFVDQLLAVNPGANVVVAGDLNDFEFSTPLNIVKGLDGGGSQVLYSMIETLPEDQRYTYVFQGNSQTLDHILISRNLFDRGAFAYDVVHVNAEFADQISDHDPQVVSFVLPAAAAPTAQDVAVTTDEDTPVAITLVAPDPDSATITYTIVSGPSNGALSAVSGDQVTYTPNPNYSGTDSFTYRANDGTADSNTATVTISVTPVNEAPIAGNGSATTNAGTPVEVVLTATDVDNPALTFSIVTGPAHGSLGALNGNRVVYTPAAGYGGPDTFTFRASDGVNNSNVATVSITVVAPPPPTVALTVTTTGSGTVTPGSGQYEANTTVTLTATANAGSTFTGWTVDNAFAGLANPLTITMGSAHTVTAAFATTPNFSDVAGTPYEDAILALAAYGAIFGYEDGSFGPDNAISRAEMAALIVRAMSWDGEDHGNPFNDRGGLNEELWRSVGTLAWYGVAFGYGGGAFGPNDDVQYLQSISFITRAMITKGYWVKAQADDPTIYPNIPADSPHRLDLVTFVRNAGTLPGFAPNTSQASLQEPATRGWYAAALLRALESRFATTP